MGPIDLGGGSPPRVVTTSAAHQLGLTRSQLEHQLQTGRWTRLLPHTYLTRDTLTWADRLHAALAYAGPGALLSGAAGLDDLDLPGVRRPHRILVLAPPSTGAHSCGWVRVRRCERSVRPARRPGPRRAAPARAAADLAVELRRLDDVRALVADLVRRDLCSAAQLRAELDAGPRRGSAHLRSAIEEVSAGAWSAPEAQAGSLLRRDDVPPFTQNARIRLPDGRDYVADFLWPELLAVLEIDSYRYHSLPADRDATADRHLLLETLGYSVVHRTPIQVRDDPHRFVADVRAWLAARQLAVRGPAS